MHSPVCRSLRGPWALLGSAITNTPQRGGTPAGPTLPPTRCHTHRSTPAAPNETQTDLTFCQSVPVAFPTAPRVGYQLPSQTRGAAGDLGARVMSWNSGCHGGERGAAASGCLTWGPPEDGCLPKLSKMESRTVSFFFSVTNSWGSVRLLH